MTEHGGHGGTRGYETRDASARALLVYGIVLIAAVVLVLRFSKGLLEELRADAELADRKPHPLAPERQEPPEPRLQVSPLRDLAEHRAAQERLLGSYEWIDRENDVVRVPVERAMQLIVERGGALR